MLKNQMKPMLNSIQNIYHKLMKSRHHHQKVIVKNDEMYYLHQQE